MIEFKYETIYLSNTLAYNNSQILLPKMEIIYKLSFSNELDDVFSMRF